MRHELVLTGIFVFVLVSGVVVPTLCRAQATATKQASPAPGMVRTNPNDGLKYVWIPAGKFLMGCGSTGDECEDIPNVSDPVHEVTISKGFWLGQTEVTQSAYEKMTGTNPSRFIGANRPVDNVSWDDAQKYCRMIGGRLPSEAEWEYSARAGTAGARYVDLERIGWIVGSPGTETHDVAMKDPNKWGLYDTLGNVWEWTADWYGQKYYESSPAKDPLGPSAGAFRVVRGGSCYGNPKGYGVAVRDRYIQGICGFVVGFRCSWPQ